MRSELDTPGCLVEPKRCRCNTLCSATRISTASFPSRMLAFFVPGGGSMTLSPEQVAALGAHVTTGQAADRVRRTPATIRSWVARGYLHPVNPDGPGQKVFRVVDVLRCDRDRRNSVTLRMQSRPA